MSQIIIGDLFVAHQLVLNGGGVAALRRRRSLARRLTGELEQGENICDFTRRWQREHYDGWSENDFINQVVQQAAERCARRATDRRAQRLPLAWRLSKSAEVASWDNCCDDVGNKYSGQLGPAVSRQTATSFQGGKFCGVWAQYENEQEGEKKKRSRFVVVVLLSSSPLAAVHLASTVHTTMYFLVVMLENAAGNSRYNWVLGAAVLSTLSSPP